MTFQAAAALLVSAFLFGGALLYSSAFATFLFRTLPAVEAGGLLRRAFASYYLWLIATSALAALLYVGVDGTSSLLLLAVALSTVPVRQYLMPAVNAASERGEKRRFHRLHSASVAIGVLQLVAAGYVLLRVL